MIKKYKVTKDEFWKLDREIIVGSLDEFLTPLREKFFDTKSDYYRLLNTMTKTPFFKNLTDLAYKDL